MAHRTGRAVLRSTLVALVLFMHRTTLVLLWLGSGCRPTALEESCASSASANCIASSRTVLELPLGAMESKSRIVPVVDVATTYGRAPFLVDTAATLSGISPSLAADWKLQVIPTSPRNVLTPGKPDGVEIRSMAHAPSLLIGNREFRGIELALLPLPNGIPGVIGHGILTDSPVSFSAATSRPGSISVLSERELHDLTSSWQRERRWTALPVVWRGRLPCIELEVRGRRLHFLVDTGSATSDLRYGAALELGLQQVDPNHDGILVDLSGSRTVPISTFESCDLEFGGWTLRMYPSSIPDSHQVVIRADGVLGYDFLRQVEWVFDAPHSRLHIKRPLESSASVLTSRLNDGPIAYAEDPLPYFRILACHAVATIDDDSLVASIAKLLDDPNLEVREAAAETIAAKAGIEWPDATRVEQARQWWSENEGVFGVRE